MNIDMTDLEFILTSTSMSQNNSLTYHVYERKKLT